MKRSDPLVEALDTIILDLGNIRIEAIRVKRLLMERFGSEYEEKTPVKPTSQTALEAFKTSSDFLSGKKKPEPPHR